MDTITKAASVSCDLTGITLEDAIKQCTPDWYKERNFILICSPQDAVLAGRLAEKHLIKQVVVTELFTDQWILVNGLYSFHSEGA